MKLIAAAGISTGLIGLMSLAGCGGSSEDGPAAPPAPGPATVTSYSSSDQVGYRFRPDTKFGSCTTGLAFWGLNRIMYRETVGAPLKTAAAPATGGGFTLSEMAANGGAVGPSFTYDSATGGRVTTDPYYWSSLSAAPAKLKLYTGKPFAIPQSINSSGIILGVALGTSGLPEFIKWTSPTAAPVKITAPATASLVAISNTGVVAFRTGSGTSSGIEIASALGSALKKLTPPTGLDGFLNYVFADNGDLYVNAAKGFGGTTDIKAQKVNPSTGALTPLPTPAGASFFSVSAVGKNGWIGGTEPKSGRAVIIRGGVARYLDELITLASGEKTQSIVAIFDDGSIIASGTNGSPRHFYVNHLP